MGGVVDFVSDTVHGIGEATGINDVVDTVWDSPIGKLAVLAGATYFAAPYVSSFFGGGAATGATAAEFAAADAAQMASMGLSDAAIAQNLMASGMTEQAAMLAAQEAVFGVSSGLTMGDIASKIGGALGGVGNAAANLLPNAGSITGSLGGAANIAGNLYIQQQALDFSKEQAAKAREAGLLGQQQLNQLNQEVQAKAQFKPYGITSNLGSANVDAQGNTTLGMSAQTQQLQNQLTNNALGVTAQNPMVSQSGLFNAMQSANSFQNEQQRLANEQRLASQGRLGMGSALYGGASPEQYAIEKAQQQQTTENYLASMQQASALTGQNLQNQQNATANMFAPQQGMLNLAATNATTGGQYNTALQNQAQMYSNLGQQGVNSMLGGVLNSNDLLASGQANQLGMLNSLIGSTPQYNSQGQVTGYNNNAANTIGGLFNLGSSVYNGVKSLF
jgi:hypothetical protein